MTAAAGSIGRVIASYGQRGILADSDGNRYRYVLKGRRLRVVCGDSVNWQPGDKGNEAVVTGVRERRNALERPDSRGKTELLAANLSRIVVVIAPEPAPDFYLIDRYICAAEMQGIAAAVAWNKADITNDLPAELTDYAKLGYPILRTSATEAKGIEALAQALREGVSLLAGQSGVGKSSLINALIPSADVTVGTLSVANREGRHTTTASFMHTLPGGGELIDTPGVREFAPVMPDLSKVQNGFREILSLAAECRFSDCQHVREPDCAVKKACESGRISARRYASYKRLRNSAAGLQ
jgi:ribosome biogenesis GTPase / thiamine phosphate phosphatase